MAPVGHLPVCLDDQYFYNDCILAPTQQADSHPDYTGAQSLSFGVAMMKSLSSLMFVIACGGSGSSTSTGSGSPTSSYVGGCVAAGLYCYDFVGASWDAASAQAQCDQISDDLVSGGFSSAGMDSTGCPSNATAECTGFEGIPGDSDSEIIIYYYQDPPISVAELGCTGGGGTYTLY